MRLGLTDPRVEVLTPGIPDASVRVTVKTRPTD